MSFSELLNLDEFSFKGKYHEVLYHLLLFSSGNSLVPKYEYIEFSMYSPRCPCWCRRVIVDVALLLWIWRKNSWHSRVSSKNGNSYSSFKESDRNQLWWNCSFQGPGRSRFTLEKWGWHQAIDRAWALLGSLSGPLGSTGSPPKLSRKEHSLAHSSVC